MKWLSFVLGQSRGPRNALTRLPTIVYRFGISPAKSQANLDIVMDVTDWHGVRPTFPITAVTAKRHPEMVRALQARGAEIAAHGLVHNDYASLTAEQQRDQVAASRTTLEGLGLTIRGWRCPYSRWNAETMAALSSAGFEYDATPVYDWPAYEREAVPLSREARDDYGRFVALSSSRHAMSHVVLPTMLGNLVQIPMSIPQDEDMVDRLHLDAETMSRVWIRVLSDTRDRGECFVMCLHPERASLFRDALDATLQHARRCGDVWIVPLVELAEWWRERERIEVRLSISDGQCRIEVQGSNRTVTSLATQRLVGEGELRAPLNVRPVVRCGTSWPATTHRRLRDAGYLVEGHGDGEVALDLDACLSPDTAPDTVVLYVREHDSDLVRVAPWPDGYRVALSITADIDAITLYDFAMRLKEF